MADINEQKYRFELLGTVQIPLDHLPPLLFLFFRYSGIPVTGQIHQIKLIIDIIEIDCLRLAGSRGNTRIRFPVHKRIDQGRFPYVGFSGKCHFRFIVYRQGTCDPAHCFQINTSDYHIILLSALFPALHPYSLPV